MQTINVKFINDEQLKIFIKDKKIVNNKNILLQIFSGVCELEYLENLITLIKDLVPQIKIIGSTTDGEIIDDEVSEYSTILSFSIFENTKIATYFTDVIHNDSYKTAENLIK